MKALSFVLLTLFFCSANCVAQSKVSDLTCPPGTFYSAHFQTCMPSAPETLPSQNPAPAQCPAGYIYNSQSQSCGKGSDSGGWSAPVDPAPQRCSPGSVYDTRLKTCIKNRYN